MVLKVNDFELDEASLLTLSELCPTTSRSYARLSTIAVAFGSSEGVMEGRVN